MGSIPSQLNTSSLKVVNKLPDDDKESTNSKFDTSDNGLCENKSTEFGVQREKTSPKILVSVVDRTTVIISEGRSVATQTDAPNGTDSAKLKTESNEPSVNNELITDNVENVEGKIEGEPSNKYDNFTDNELTDAELTKELEAIHERDAEATSDEENTEMSRKLAWQGHKAPVIREYTGLDLETPVPPQQHDKSLIQTVSLSPRAEIPFEELAINKYGKYKVRLQSDAEKCIVSAAVFLETGDAVIIDRSNMKLKFVDSKFQFISSHELPVKPWAVCSRGMDLYVTMGNTHIQHFHVEDMILEPGEIFQIVGRCLGICVYKDYLAVGLQVGEICFITFKGEVTKSIKLPETQLGRPCNPWHLYVSKQENIIVTDSDAGTIFCLNENSEVIFTFLNMTSPRATSVDYHGNILVVGRDMSTAGVVMVLHKDMELLTMLHMDTGSEPLYRTLLSWEELEFVPYCVSYRPDDVIVLGGIQECLKIMRLSDLPEDIEE